MTVYSRNYYPYGYTRQPSGAAQFGTRFIEGLMGTLQRRQQMVEQRRTEQLNALAQTYTAGVRNPLAFSQEDLTKTTEGLNRLLGGQINIPTPDRSAALQAQEFERQQTEFMEDYRNRQLALQQQSLEADIEQNRILNALKKREQDYREQQGDYRRLYPDITDAQKAQLATMDSDFDNAQKTGAEFLRQGLLDEAKKYFQIAQQISKGRKTLVDQIIAQSRGESTQAPKSKGRGLKIPLNKTREKKKVDPVAEIINLLP